VGERVALLRRPWRQADRGRPARVLLRRLSVAGQQELAELLLFLGDAEKLAGDAPGARGHFARAHALIKAQAEAFPQAVPVAVLLAKSYLRLAGVDRDADAARASARAPLERVGSDHLDGDGKKLLDSLRP
jgi:hypothetical protein